MELPSRIRGGYFPLFFEENCNSVNSIFHRSTKHIAYLEGECTRLKTLVDHLRLVIIVLVIALQYVIALIQLSYPNIVVILILYSSFKR